MGHDKRQRQSSIGLRREGPGKPLIQKSGKVECVHGQCWGRWASYLNDHRGENPKKTGKKRRLNRQCTPTWDSLKRKRSAWWEGHVGQEMLVYLRCE